MYIRSEIWLGDCLEILPTFEAEFVDLVVTSPPYNVGKEYSMYDDSRPYASYLSFLEDAFKEVYRVLGIGGRLALNLPFTRVSRKRSFLDAPRENLYADVCSILKSIGFKYRDLILWDKGHTWRRTAWGSFASPSNPYVVSPVESIGIWHKITAKHRGYRQADITREEFVEWSNAHWCFPGETSIDWHPAPFPEELPRRLIKFYTYPGDMVLDPFLGSGTTVKVARELGRCSIGIEIDPSYCERAVERALGPSPSAERVGDFIRFYLEEDTGV